jgi:hypothetical protein
VEENRPKLGRPRKFPVNGIDQASDPEAAVDPEPVAGPAPAKKQKAGKKAAKKK